MAKAVWEAAGEEGDCKVHPGIYGLWWELVRCSDVLKLEMEAAEKVGADVDAAEPGNWSDC